MEAKTQPTVRSYQDLRVFQGAMDGCIEVFSISKKFPPEERFSLTDQVRRSSRSVCANLAEAWRNRRHKGAFIAKLDDSLGEATETQVWLEIARRCRFLSDAESENLVRVYDKISAQLVSMIQTSEKWLVPAPENRAAATGAEGRMA